MAKQSNNALVGAIIFAAVAISGSLVFFGMQVGGGMNDDNLKAAITDGIEEYVKEVQEESQRPPEPVRVDADLTDDDAFLGDADAPLTIVEFSDYECPFCGKFFSGAYSQLKENYIDTGLVKLVYRDFPLSFHPNAQEAAEAAECAGDQGEYFGMHDQIFENQSSLSLESYQAHAQVLGLDLDEFNDCMESDKHVEEIMADMAEGQAYGVSGTPGFFINGYLVEGAQPYSVFEQVIEAELEALDN